MLWVTRSRIRVNRAATGWLIRRFVDPGATFSFVDPAEVARIQLEDRAIGFDAPGATYPHQDGAGRCSFEALVEEHRPTDGALRALARIVHRADFPEEAGPGPSHHTGSSLGTLDTVSLLLGWSSHRSPLAAVPEAMGLRTIAQGFPLVAVDDEETLERSRFLYDALYASIRDRLGT
jgi:hypothetical protein